MFITSTSAIVPCYVTELFARYLQNIAYEDSHRDLSRASLDGCALAQEERTQILKILNHHKFTVIQQVDDSLTVGYNTYGCTADDREPEWFDEDYGYAYDEQEELRVDKAILNGATRMFELDEAIAQHLAMDLSPVGIEDNEDEDYGDDIALNEPYHAEMIRRERKNWI